MLGSAWIHWYWWFQQAAIFEERLRLSSYGGIRAQWIKGDGGGTGQNFTFCFFTKHFTSLSYSSETTTGLSGPIHKQDRLKHPSTNKTKGDKVTGTFEKIKHHSLNIGPQQALVISSATFQFSQSWTIPHTTLIFNIVSNHNEYILITVKLWEKAKLLNVRKCTNHKILSFH